jgi:hypothetical protein
LVEIVIAIGAVIVLIGAVGMLLPGAMRFLVHIFRSRIMLIVATALRVGIGLVLVLAASRCRFSDAVRVLGFVAIAAGLLIPLLGTARINRLFDWISDRSDNTVRLGSMVAILLGGFLLIAAL